jgi:hypothetical protein
MLVKKDLRAGSVGRDPVSRRRFAMKKRVFAVRRKIKYEKILQ